VKLQPTINAHSICMYFYYFFFFLFSIPRSVSTIYLVFSKSMQKEKKRNPHCQCGICIWHTITTARTAQNRYYTASGLESPDLQCAN
jgi:hypothetical protein